MSGKNEASLGGTRREVSPGKEMTKQRWGAEGVRSLGQILNTVESQGRFLKQSKGRIVFTPSQDYSSCCVEREERTGQRKDRKQEDPLPLYCNRWWERCGRHGLRVRVRRHGGALRCDSEVESTGFADGGMWGWRVGRPQVQGPSLRLEQVGESTGL